MRDVFETVDGSKPEVVTLQEDVGRRFPLAAFAVLQGGDVFESAFEGSSPNRLPRASQFVSHSFLIETHGASSDFKNLIWKQIAEQIAGNAQLISRLELARGLAIDVIPTGKKMQSFGYPATVSPNAIGLFWDTKNWPKARMALKQEALERDSVTLVVHEMAHALHAMAFTQSERELIYRTLLPTYRNRAAIDEVFSIYTEREFSSVFSEREKYAPGIYGLARRRWNEKHLFTRFVRHLYFPEKPLAGDSDI